MAAARLVVAAVVAVVVVLAVAVQAQERTAVAVLQHVSSGTIRGTISFSESGGNETTVTVAISGLGANAVHGFHVHMFGDTSDLAAVPPSTGYHFFPYCPPEMNCSNDQTHGLPPSAVRHAGDMGNILADGSGRVDRVLTLGQNKLSLEASNIRSILGRAVVVHEGEDDGNQPYGNAGDVVAAGVIGMRSTTDPSIGPSNPTTDMLCILHDKDELQNSPDNDARGFVLVAHHDLRDHAHVKIKLKGVPAANNTVVQVLEYGDLTNVPTSLGAAFADSPIHSLSLSAKDTCNGYKYHFTTVESIDMSQHIGRACVVRNGGSEGEITAAGVFGRLDVVRESALFSDAFFDHNSCDASDDDGGGGGGLSHGHIAAIVLGVLVGAGLLGAVWVRCRQWRREQGTEMADQQQHQHQAVRRSMLDP